MRWRRRRGWGGARTIEEVTERRKERTVTKEQLREEGGKNQGRHAAFQSGKIAVEREEEGKKLLCKASPVQERPKRLGVRTYQ